jgi:hypothetical protein
MKNILLDNFDQTEYTVKGRVLTILGLKFENYNNINSLYSIFIVISIVQNEINIKI